VSGDVVAAVVALRTAHPTWGPKKLSVLVAKQYPDEAPSVRTVARILERTGLVRRVKRRRRSVPGPGPVRVEARSPNDLWTVDFKGWWQSQNGERCEPLTVSDAFSRFVLAIDVMKTGRMAAVIEAFERIFSRYGLPRYTLVDNGIPWVSTTSSVGLTQLSAWWLSLGIEVVRTRLGCPADNGGHERMHRDMAADLEAYRAMNRAAQQRACELWRHDFNHVRPHEALDMRTPSQLYRRSSVGYDGKPTVQIYPDDFIVLRVSSCGQIRYAKTYAFISSAVQGYDIGLRYADPYRYHVWFCHRRLGLVDFSEPPGKLLAAPWNNGILSKRANSPESQVLLSEGDSTSEAQPLTELNPESSVT